MPAKRLICSVILSICGIPAVGLEPAQVTAWETDLDFLLAEFPKKEGGFTDDERAAFEAQIAKVRANLSTWDDEHIIVGVMRATAHARNGHTGAYPSRDDTRFGRVPIRLWYFADGLYVVRARAGYEHLLGTKVTGVGGRPIEEVVERVATLAYGNQSWKRHVPSIRLTIPALLFGLDVITTRDRAEYEFVKQDGVAVRETLVIEPPRWDIHLLAIWDLAPLSQTPDGEWKYAYADTSEKAPLYLRNPNRVLWEEYLKKQKTLYVQYNSSLFREDDDRHALITEMLEAVQSNKIEKMVVDLRLNGGGDLTQMRGAFNRMLREDAFKKPGRLYVITGQSTFSAGLFHAANLKEQGATVVGELVGDNLDFWAEGRGQIELPNSKLRVGASTGFHSYSKIEHPEWKDKLYLDLGIDTLDPDIPVALTFADYMAGRDPALEAILAR